MILADQIKELEQRREALERCLGIDQKRIDLRNEEEKTQEPDFWDAPDKAREHLFEAFQGGARKGGTGLGLAISAELVRGHGGRLELARSDAEGTEFLIHLPKMNQTL